MIREDLSKARKVVILGVIVLLAMTLRMYRLGHESFWVDEVHQVRVASQDFMEIIENYKQETAHETHDQAPLSMLVTHFFVSDTDAEYWARIPTVVFGVVGVVAIYLFSRIFLAFVPSALAAFFLAISPLAVWYSQDARWYSMWGMGTTLSYIALVKAVEKPRSTGPWIAYFLITLANLYTFVYTVFVLAAQGISLLLREAGAREKVSSIVTFFCINIAVFAASIPVILMIVQRAETDQFYSGTARVSSLFELPYTFLTYVTGFTIGPSLSELHGPSGVAEILKENPVLYVVGAVFIPVALVGMVHVGRDRRLGAWVLPWMVLPPLAVFLAALIAPELTYQVRYTFAALAPFVLMVAVGVSSFKGAVRGVAFGSVVALSIYSLANFYWAEKYDKADARAAIAFLRTADEGPVQLVAVGQIEYAMYYYAHHPEIEVFRDCGTDEGMDGEVDRGETIWLISGRDWNHDKDRCLPNLESTHRIAEYQTFTGIELWRLEPREEDR